MRLTDSKHKKEGGKVGHREDPPECRCHKRHWLLGRAAEKNRGMHFKGRGNNKRERGLLLPILTNTTGNRGEVYLNRGSMGKKGGTSMLESLIPPAIIKEEKRGGGER